MQESDRGSEHQQKGTRKDTEEMCVGSLFLRLDELVVLHRHLAAEGLACVCSGAVGVDDVDPSWEEEHTQ